MEEALGLGSSFAMEEGRGWLRWAGCWRCDGFAGGMGAWGLRRWRTPGLFWWGALPGSSARAAVETGNLGGRGGW